MRPFSSRVYVLTGLDLSAGGLRARPLATTLEVMKPKPIQLPLPLYPSPLLALEEQAVRARKELWLPLRRPSLARRRGRRRPAIAR